MVTVSLAGRTAVVTGAGSGIGRAIATTFAAAGAAVACLDLDRISVDAVAKAITGAGGRTLALACDVSSEADTHAAVEATQSAFGPIHILVNGAAADDPNGTVLDLTLVDWKRVFAVNVTG